MSLHQMRFSRLEHLMDEIQENTGNQLDGGTKTLSDIGLRDITVCLIVRQYLQHRTWYREMGRKKSCS